VITVVSESKQSKIYICSYCVSMAGFKHNNFQHGTKDHRPGCVKTFVDPEQCRDEGDVGLFPMNKSALN